MRLSTNVLMLWKLCWVMTLHCGLTMITMMWACWISCCRVITDV